MVLDIMQQLCIPKWGKCLRQWWNVHNSGEIEYALALTNLRLEIVIHNSA